MLFSNPRVLPALLLCVGLGVVLIRGQELRNTPEWTERELETAVELNFALDLARQGSSGQTVAPMTEAERQARQADIRRELIATFVEPRQQREKEFRQGLWMSIAGAVLMAIVLVLQQRGILKR